MKYVISGIAGFIGSNLADRLLRHGNTVIGLDNLGRKGTKENIKRIRSAGGELSFHQGDIRDNRFLCELFTQHRNAEPCFNWLGRLLLPLHMERWTTF